jgi:hypothetical protein
MPRTDIIEDTLADDLLWGVDGKDGMAAFLNIKPSRAYYLIGRASSRLKSTHTAS